MARRWSDPRSQTNTPYLQLVELDLEEARAAMAAGEPRRAKRHIRDALERRAPEAYQPHETVVLVALGIGLMGPEPVAELDSTAAKESAR